MQTELILEMFPALEGLLQYFWIAIIWSLIWKGIALWQAGTKKDKGWFIAIFLLNTLGILDILYIFVFSKRKSLREEK